MILLVLKLSVIFSFNTNELETWLQEQKHTSKENIHQHLCSFENSRRAYYFALQRENEGGIQLGVSNLSLVLDDFAKAEDKEDFCSDSQKLIYTLDFKSQLLDSFNNNNEGELIDKTLRERIEPDFTEDLPEGGQ